MSDDACVSASFARDNSDAIDCSPKDQPSHSGKASGRAADAARDDGGRRGGSPNESISPSAI
jgi:hypothetical protein